MVLSLTKTSTKVYKYSSQTAEVIHTEEKDTPESDSATMATSGVPTTNSLDRATSIIRAGKTLACKRNLRFGSSRIPKQFRVFYQTNAVARFVSCRPNTKVTQIH